MPIGELTAVQVGEFEAVQVGEFEAVQVGEFEAVQYCTAVNWLAEELPASRAPRDARILPPRRAKLHLKVAGDARRPKPSKFHCQFN